MNTWSNHVTLLGNAAYAASFHTMTGKAWLYKVQLFWQLQSNDDYKTVFAKYHEKYMSCTESLQSRLRRGMKLLVPRNRRRYPEGL